MLEMVIERAAFLDSLSEAFAQYVEETRGMFGDDLEDEDPLEAAGHPPLEEVMQRPALFTFVIRECIPFWFLEAFAHSAQPRYWISDIVAATGEPGAVTVRCLAEPATRRR